jgi:GxxExxY protein
MPPLNPQTLDDWTSKIIAAAIAIHRALGPGLLESAYFACLCYELHTAGMRLEVQSRFRLCTAA